ncbi:MAG TPA: glycosyltransferase family 87 protein [Candidatus Dormibacteraeota bacterium]|nr:glycosyltransferase family 87 protein [Candidatus Dormibacteraeota bacterium]
MLDRSTTRLPPIWLSASALTAAITVIFGVQRWIYHFTTDPYAQDVRVWVIASRIGLTYGWSHIYDINLEKAVAAGFGPSGSLVDAMHIFVAPPPAAWVMVPLAWMPIPAAYLIWTIVNVAAFIAAGWLVCPGSRFAKATLILVGLALWPIHYQFWLGQWVVTTLALLGVAWWLLDRERWLAAGICIALAIFAKPQDAWLVPVALLVSGRWRPVVACAVAGAILGAASVATLGLSGVHAWFDSLQIARTNPFMGPLTYTSLFGHNTVATAAELAFGLVAIGLAWYRRDRLDLVFALGILGTIGSANYLHEDDIGMLVLAAWIVLRSQPSLQMKLWLLVGVVAAQLISIGMPVPILLWEPGFLLLLALEPRPKREAITATLQPEPATA